MRYRYRSDEEMKYSGVEWIGKIPKDWEISKFKYFFNFGMGETILTENLIEKGIPVYSATEEDVILGYYDKAKLILVEGDIIIPARGNSIGASKFVEHKCTCTQTTIYGKLKSNINSKFVYYFTIGNRKKLFQYDKTAIPQITTSQVRENNITYSIRDEQDKIANFLDEKTSQFDLIISKKEELIKKLEEAKKSLISEVVTGKVKVVKTDDGYEIVKRKMDEMKDSGVEWLGDIPKDWEYGQLKYLCSYITDGAHISPETENGVYPFLSVKDLKNGHLDFKNCLLTSSNNYEYLKRNSCNPKLGDVLISKDGTIGKTVTIEYDKNFVVASSLVILRPKKFLQPKYFEYILNSKSAQEQINSFAKGAALPRISIMHLKEILLSFTRDIIEQGDIVNYLSIELNRIDSIINKTKLQIEKLKEAKQSLISEAVTGKIEILD